VTEEAGPAVLELGPGVGAAVVYTTAALDHRELEIKPTGRDWDGTHTAIRKRPGRGPVYAALFYGLPEGSYDIRVRGGPSVRTIQITEGRVTEASMT
jgi:hypothetical protein